MNMEDSFIGAINLDYRTFGNYKNSWRWFGLIIQMIVQKKKYSAFGRLYEHVHTFTE